MGDGFGRGRIQFPAGLKDKLPVKPAAAEVVVKRQPLTIMSSPIKVARHDKDEVLLTITGVSAEATRWPHEAVLTRKQTESLIRALQLVLG